MGRAPIGFACAPHLAPDELLGSWLSRVAVGHGVPVGRFLESTGAPLVSAVDLDWACPGELLTWLARGSGRPRSELAARTLSVAHPGQPRSAFALAAGDAFPGGHAFCPWCEREDVARWGQPIMRRAHAGVFQMTCHTHAVYLDGADERRDLDPWRDKRGHWRSRLQGRPPRLAPKFAIAFERALKRAASGQPPGAAWMVRVPTEFVQVTRELVGLVMIQRRCGAGFNDSAALNLLTDSDLSRAMYGISSHDERLLDRLTTWPRVRALTAVALLLIRSRALRRLQGEAWAAHCLSAFSEWRKLGLRPWSVAAPAWSRETAEVIANLRVSWPTELCETMRDQLPSHFSGWLIPRTGACQEARRAF